MQLLKQHGSVFVSGELHVCTAVNVGLDEANTHRSTMTRAGNAL